jgi:integrase
MAFVTDKEELKPGLIIFRRADVAHRNWYCRVKLPKADRYKTVSLKTDDITTARSLAWDHDGEVRYATKRGDPIFNRPFRAVAKDWLAEQSERAKRGEISKERPRKLRTVIEATLNEYVGSTQIHLVGPETWEGYPAWRRATGEGRSARNGSREVSAELAAKLVARDRAAREKAKLSVRRRSALPEDPMRKRRQQGRAAEAELQEAVAQKKAGPVRLISDATIRFEMTIFGQIMNYAIKKRYVPASQRFDDRPKLKTMRRDEFTLEEYQQLYTFSRNKWVKGQQGDGKKLTDCSRWYRAMTHDFVLIMCNTGMRPSEAKNLRWRDISTAKDGEGRDITVLFVQGKGKSRKLVAPKSVGEYLGRIRERSEATGPNDAVFTTSNGKPAKMLYKSLIEDLLTKAGLRVGPCGTIRSTYSFRHTYATLRLSEGIDVYFLAEQMGTSVKMIEDHYGHVNTIKHADRVLHGMGGWNPVENDTDSETDEIKEKPTKPRKRVRNSESDAKASKAAATRNRAKGSRTRSATRH